MYEDIKRMLAAAYELEGLLMLADSRGDDTPEMVFTAIREKIENLAKAAEGLNFSACENTPEPTADMPSENADGPSLLDEIDTDNAEETTEAPLTRNSSRNSTWKTRRQKWQWPCTNISTICRKQKKRRKPT